MTLNPDRRIDLKDRDGALEKALAEVFKGVLEQLKETTNIKHKELIDMTVVSMNPQLKELLVDPILKNKKHIKGAFQDILLRFTDIVSNALSNSLLLDFGLDFENQPRRRRRRR